MASPFAPPPAARDHAPGFGHEAAPRHPEPVPSTAARSAPHPPSQPTPYEPVPYESAPSGSPSYGSPSYEPAAYDSPRYEEPQRYEPERYAAAPAAYQPGHERRPAPPRPAYTWSERGIAPTGPVPAARRSARSGDRFRCGLRFRAPGPGATPPPPPAPPQQPRDRVPGGPGTGPPHAQLGDARPGPGPGSGDGRHAPEAARHAPPYARPGPGTGAMPVRADQAYEQTAYEPTYEQAYDPPPGPGGGAPSRYGGYSPEPPYRIPGAVDPGTMPARQAPDTGTSWDGYRGQHGGGYGSTAPPPERSGHGGPGHHPADGGPPPQPSGGSSAGPAARSSGGGTPLRRRVRGATSGPPGERARPRRARTRPAPR